MTVTFVLENVPSVLISTILCTDHLMTAMHHLCEHLKMTYNIRFIPLCIVSASLMYCMYMCVMNSCLTDLVALKTTFRNRIVGRAY